MFRKVGRKHGGSDDGHGGLLITPLLDLLVVLMPILILGVVMTRINIVDVAVSKPVASLKKTTLNNFDLLLKVKSSDFEIILNGKTRSKILQNDPEYLQKLHNEFVSIKKEFPDEFELKIEPESETVLDNIMLVIDSARELQNQNEVIIRKDEATGKDVRIKYLFPRVVLRGVYT
jgi:biopolymer transport protein ExbD